MLNIYDCEVISTVKKTLLIKEIFVFLYKEKL